MSSKPIKIYCPAPCYRWLADMDPRADYLNLICPKCRHRVVWTIRDGAAGAIRVPKAR